MAPLVKQQLFDLLGNDLGTSEVKCCERLLWWILTHFCGR